MRKAITTLFTAICACLFITGCSDDSKLSKKDLERTIWKCSQIEYDANDNVIATGGEFVLEFLTDDSGNCHFVGSEGNFYSEDFGYEVTDSSITFEGIVPLNGTWYISARTDKTITLQIYRTVRVVMTMNRTAGN